MSSSTPLLLWFALILCGLLLAVRRARPTRQKTQRPSRGYFDVWLTDLRSYHGPEDAWPDPLYDTQPTETSAHDRRH